MKDQYDHADLSPLKPIPLAIIGGGAAGLFAAAIAARERLGAVIFERKARPGSKLLMTANGRCNFTRDLSADEFLRDLGRRDAADFAADAVRRCPPREIIRFFRDQGVPLRRMADARMFPADGKAATIAHAFGDLLRDAAIPLVLNCAVKAVERVNDPGAPFRIRLGAFDLTARRVLIATGGASYPKTGSVGDGQNFARAFGHRIVPLRAGLIGLETDDPKVVRLAGRRFEDGRVMIFDPQHPDRCLFDYRGEVDCERFGLSGAAIYNAQRFLAHRGDERDAPELEVWFGHERLRYRGLRPRPLKEAIVTLGGVALDEVDPHTMESRLVPGLHFAGEVLDLDGPTGGYNLSLAFATAFAAVTSLRPPPNQQLHRHATSHRPSRKF